jgi:protein TonB
MTIKSLSLAMLFAFYGMYSYAQDSVKVTTSPRPPADPDKVFTKVDKPAEFKGGIDGWTSYLQQNLRYPNKAVRKNIQGIVRVQFIVDRAGNISEVQALNDPGGGLAEESVRIIKSGPTWTPAEQNGRKVIYRHIQAITFRLE